MDRTKVGTKQRCAVDPRALAQPSNTEVRIVADQRASCNNATVTTLQKAERLHA